MDMKKRRFRDPTIRLVALCLISITVCNTLIGCESKSISNSINHQSSNANGEAESTTSEETFSISDFQSNQAGTDNSEGIPSYDDDSSSNADGIEYSSLENETSEDLEEPYDYKRALAQRRQSFSAEDVALDQVQEVFPGKKNYTVMVYMTGSNLESKLGNATKDMMEMENAGLAFKQSNLLVFTGGSRRWNCSVPNDCNCVLDFSRDKEKRIVAQTSDIADMGAPETLSTFINFCVENYPANHYALILWDHGGGPLWGYGSDEIYESDALLLDEMARAMDATVFSKNQKLDWVGFDACLMGCFECMSVWSKYADYYVASEELEPGDGWDYSFLSVLNKTDDPLNVTDRILDSYEQYYKGIQTEEYNPDVTLSCVDLSQVKETISQLNFLSGELRTELEKGKYSSIQKARSDAKSFGLVEESRSGTPFSYDLVDMKDLAEKLEENVPDRSSALQEQLKKLIVRQYSNVAGASGVSVYYPFLNKNQYREMNSFWGENVSSDPYRYLVEELSKKWLSGNEKDWKLGELQPNGDDYTLALTAEQMENYSSAYYTVFSSEDGEEYVPQVSHCRIKPDKEGVLHIPSNLHLYAFETDQNEKYIWPVEELENRYGRAVYRTAELRLSKDAEYHYSSDMILGWMEASIVFSRDTETDEIVVQAINGTGDQLTAGGKNTIDLNHYEKIYISSEEYTPVKEDGDRILPYMQWEETGLLQTSAPIDESFRIVNTDITSSDQSYALQVVVEDTQGNAYGSKIIKLHDDKEYMVVKENTENGVLTYDVYSDHAEVERYEGTDLELIIPEEIGGVPVTIIGDVSISSRTLWECLPLQRVILPETIEKIGVNAFYNCEELVHVEMHNHLQQIGSAAFLHCSSLKEITIPDSVTSLGKAVFIDCTSLEKISLPASLEKCGTGLTTRCKSLSKLEIGGKESGKMSRYWLDNGVLMTEDKKTVLAYPAAKKEPVTLKEGIEEIAYGAFSCTQIEEIRLPKTLKAIGNYAFYGATNLKVPVFPEHLQEIGYQAFSVPSFTFTFSEEPLPQDSIHLGSELCFIDGHAFDGFRSKKFEVDRKNPFYSSREGSLCNKAGDYIHTLASNGKPEAVIPEGITDISWDCLQYLTTYDTLMFNGDFDLFCPNTLLWIPADESLLLMDLSRIVVHGQPNSLAEKMAKNYNMQFSDK